MSLFRITGGKLVPTDPECSNVAEVYAKHGYVERHPELIADEEIVVVSDSLDPFWCIPEGVIVSTGFTDDEPGELLLFRVTNEDEGDESQVVAVSAKETMSPDGWKIVESECWTQVGSENVLVRAFANMEGAQRELIDNRFIFVSLPEVAGWRGILVHGQNMGFDPITSDHSKVVEALGIPEGWLDLSENLGSRPAHNVLEEAYNPFKGRADIVRAILTENGIFLVAVENDGANGCKFFAREFTQGEASGGHIRL